MTLSEAIIHCEEVADRCAVTDGNLKCEMQHRQLAEWLELQQRRVQSELNPCKIGWIPCSERLPKKKGLYWVTVKVKYEEGLEVLYSEQREWSGKRWGELSCAHCGVGTITAWMPMPEPYKGDN